MSDADELFSFNTHPIVEILSLTSPNSAQNRRLSGNTFSFSFKGQNNSSILHKMYSELSNTTQDLVVLSKLELPDVYLPNHISDFDNSSLNSERTGETICYRILRTSMLWLKYVAECGDYSDANQIINTLNSFIIEEKKELFLDMTSYILLIMPIKNISRDMVNAYVNMLRKYDRLKNAQVKALIRCLLSDKRDLESYNLILSLLPDLIRKCEESIKLSAVSECLDAVAPVLSLSFEEIMFLASIDASKVENKLDYMIPVGIVRLIKSGSPFIRPYEEEDSGKFIFTEVTIDVWQYPEAVMGTLSKLDAALAVFPDSDKADFEIFHMNLCKEENSQFYADIAFSFMYFLNKTNQLSASASLYENIIESDAFRSDASIFNTDSTNLGHLLFRRLSLDFFSNIRAKGNSFLAVASNKPMKIAEFVYIISCLLQEPETTIYQTDYHLDSLLELARMWNPEEVISPLNYFISKEFLKIILLPQKYPEIFSKYYEFEAVFRRLQSLNFDYQEVFEWALKKWRTANFEEFTPVLSLLLKFTYPIENGADNMTFLKHPLEYFIQNAEQNLYIRDIDRVIESSTKHLFYEQLNNSHKQFLSYILNVFVVASPHYVFNAHDRKAIVHGISKIEASEPSKETLETLFDIMTNNDQSSQIITQPKIAGIIVQVYKSTHLIADIIHRFSVLCDRLIMNKISLHDGYLDLSLIDLIKEDIAVDESFSLLADIASVVSSSQVVRSVISLFIPSDAVIMSKHFSKTLDLVEKCSLMSKNAPNSYIPVAKDNAFIVIEKVPTNLALSGFTLSMKLLFNSIETDNLYSVFSMSSENRTFFSVYFHNSTIIFLVNNQVEGSTIQIPRKLVHSKWNQLDFIFSRDPKLKNVVCTTRINLKKEHELQVESFDLKNEHMSISIGQDLLFERSRSTTRFTKDRAQPILIGDVHISKLSSMQPVFSVWIDTRLQQSYDSKITARLVGELPRQVYSFTECLVRFFKIQILLPLFAQASLKPYHPSVNPSDILVKIVDVFVSILRCSPIAENDFVLNNNVSIIAYLLSETKEYLSVGLFSMVLLMFREARLVELQKQIFWNLLFNSDLWSNAPDNVSAHAATHWTIILCNWVTDEILGEKPFAKALEKTTKVPCDNQQITNDLLTCYLYIANKSMTESEFDYLISSIVYETETNRRIALLRTISLIAKSEARPFDRVKHRWASFLCLHRLFVSKPSHINISLMEMFITLHRYGYLHKPSLHLHTGVIMRMVSNKALDEDFFRAALNLMESSSKTPPKVPELLPLICYAANRLPNVTDNISYVLEQLCESNKYRIYVHWHIWPMMMASKASKEQRNRIIYFILLSYTEKWDEVFSIALLVDIAMANIEDITKLSLQCAMMRLLSFDRADPLLVDQCVRYTYYYFFYQTCMVSTIDGEPLNSNFTLDNLINAMKSLNSAYKVNLAIKIKKHGNGINILDYDLALLCVRLILHTRADKFYLLATNLLILLRAYIKYNEDKASALADVLTDAKHKLPRKLYNLLMNWNWLSLDDYYCSSTFKEMQDKMSETKVMIDRKRQSSAIYFVIYLETCQKKAIKYREKAPMPKPSVPPDNSGKDWHILLRRLTSVGMPWQDALAFPPPHFKRSKIICRDGCPMNMKHNNNFSDHKDASFLRDIGSLAHAKQRIDEHRINTAPVPLPKLMVPQKSDEPINTAELSKQPEYQVDAYVIEITGRKSCTFHLLSDSIRLKFSESHVVVLSASEISRIVYRPYKHRPFGLEIFIRYGKSYLLTLSTNTSTLLKKLSDFSQFKSVEIRPETVSPDPSQWVKRRESNFSYLMKLNDYAGRSFHDSSIYPVAPWVLAEWDSDTLDLNNPEMFRDLTKPMGAFGEQRRKEIDSRVKDMQTFGQSSFLYSACYSSPLCVYLWLMRMEPFTTLHIELQSGKFDHAARLFASIKDAFRMATTHMNDFRELVPEFYFCPHFLRNENQFDLGKTNDQVLNDVSLPKWANTSPELFVYLHRKALESEFVSAIINDWFDLIFGYKQRGESAEDARNTFDPMMYETAWNQETLSDAGLSQVIDATMQNCGQIPAQLFKAPHPKREKRPTVPERFYPDVKIEVSDVLYADFITGSSVSCSANGKLNNGSQVSIESITKGKGNVFTAIAKNAAAIATQHGDLILSYPKKTHILRASVGPVNCVEFQDDLLVAGGYDTTTSVWRAGDTWKHLFSVPLYNSEVVCLAINGTFGVITSAMLDGSIVVLSITKKTIINTIQTDQPRIRSLCVSPAWGFLLVNSEIISAGNTVSRLDLYHLHSLKPFKSICLDFKIEKWVSWASYDGFDYLTIVTNNRTVHIMEIAFLEPGPSIFTSATDIVSIGYDEKDELLLILESTGNLKKIDARYYLPKKTVFG